MKSKSKLHLDLAVALAFMLAPAVAALAQCPPGSSNCPIAKATAPPARNYQFRPDAGNPAPWATTVRIKAMLPGRMNVGTGTIIDGNPEGAVVMTCAHILRDNPTLTVEIFDGKLDYRTGSLGDPLAGFEAQAIDKHEAHDVALIRFSPGRPLPSSFLVPPGWTPSDEPLCSVGSNRGANPSALAERVVGLKVMGNASGQWQGYECERKPIEGRSGGGLFTAQGQLAGVCDFAADKHGLYASSESMRELLLANGLTELASGFPVRKPAQPAFDPIRKLEGEAIGAAEKEASNLVPLVLAGGIGGAGFFGGVLAFLRRKRPAQPQASTASIPAPEDLVRLLSISIKQCQHLENQKKSEAELLDQIKSLVNPPAPSPPNA